MTIRPLRNVAASVHARLLNRSRQTGEDFQFLLQRYAAERFLYRLGESIHRDRYILKGAMLFALWGGLIYRPTRDLDFTGYGSNETESVLAALREVCAVPAAEDGLAFDDAALTAEPIRDDAEYSGVRIRFQATLGDARIPMQIDIGFGNAIEPGATEIDYPTLLDAPAPRIRAYPHEAVVAEKLHAMVMLGDRNSRLKDFYDLYVLARQFPFDGVRLTRAIAATFERRHTTIDSAVPAPLAPRFYADGARAAQWRAYLTRSRLPGVPTDWVGVGELLQTFLGSPWRALAGGHAFSDTWLPGASWTASPPEKVGGDSAGNGLASVTRNAGGNAGGRRFKPYPAYKDSGDECLGEIPAHWMAVRLKRVCTLAYGDSLASDTRLDGEVEVYGSNGPVGFHEQANTLAPCLVIGRKGSFGKVNFSPKPLFAIDTTFFIDPRFTSSDIRWLYYTLTNARLDSASKDSAVPGLGREDAYARDVCLCLHEEQRAIAAFLDRETARVDVLVAKNLRLIELLQEKRISLITHAVTKGLDPNVPMKDSGVEWLGKIPAHWEVVALKRKALGIKTGSTPPTGEPLYYEEGTVAWYGPASFSEDLPLKDPVKYISDSAVRDGVARVFKAGSCMVVTIGATIGKVAYMETSGSCNQQITGVSFDLKQVFPRYGAYQLKGLEPVLRGIAPNTTLPILDQGEIGYIPLVVPPGPEQESIAAFIDRETERIDALISKIRTAIDHIEELRSALISAAVTGKIDVREEAA